MVNIFFKSYFSFFKYIDNKYAIIGVNAYITPEFDAVDILIPTRKKK